MGYTQTVVDYDGNIYDTVIIGSQVWLKQDLRVTHYNNGDLIPNITDSANWLTLTTGARCYYDNDSATYDSVYGALYNWYAASNSNKICPVGYHVPTDGQWTLLENYLGGEMVAGGPLKETGFLHWSSPNVGATNSTGFTGLPGGARGTSLDFGFIHENGMYWTYSSYGSGLAWGRYLYYLNAGVDRNPVMKYIGSSIRCLRDASIGWGESEGSGHFQVFPNPVRQILNVNMLENPEALLSLYALEGNLIFQRYITETESEIDMSFLASGTYVLSLENQKGISHLKLIKQ